MAKFYLLIMASSLVCWAQEPGACLQLASGAVSPCINNVVFSEFGQPQSPSTLNAINSAAPNLVEGREVNQPYSMAFDTSVTPNILYIADALNNRVLAYQNPAGLSSCGIGAPTSCGVATMVIGPRPTDFTTTIPGGPSAVSPALQAGFNLPEAVAVDSNGNLYVLDAGNNRILRFPAPFKQSGPQSGGVLITDLVIGQKTTTSGNIYNQGNGSIASNTSLYFTNGSTFATSLAIEPATGALWVADAGNNRVLRFPASQLAAGTTLPQADLVIGQSSFTASAAPTPPSGTTAQLVFTSLYQPKALAFDQNDNLYVSDGENGFTRVLYFTTSFSTGMSATRVLGLIFQLSNQQTAPTFPNQYALSGALGLAVDANNHLWVADTGQNRIVEYDVPANWPSQPSIGSGTPLTSQVSPPMIAVLGQPTLNPSSPNTANQPNAGQPTPGPSSVYQPFGVTFNGTDLWIADTANNRILDFPQQGGGYSTATRVVGQLTFSYNAPNLIEGREINLTSGTTVVSVAGIPYAGGGIAIDKNSNPPHLYIADTGNNRVLCFNNAYNPGTSANLVLGQTDVYSSLINSPLNTNTMTQTGLVAPTDVAVDANGNVWVADSGNGRVLRFPAPFAEPAGAQIEPTVVLGQPSFVGQPIQEPTVETMGAPYGLAIFSDGSLAISDALFNRILIFKAAPGSDFQNSQAASIVLGQTNFNSSTGSNTATGLFTPRHISADSSDRLYVTDAGNNRLIIFSSANTAQNGASSALQITGLSEPQGIKVSQLTGEAWVADSGNRRLLRLPEFNTLIVETTPTTFPEDNPQINLETQPFSLELDSSDNVVVAEQANRMTFYYAALAYQNPTNYNLEPLAPGMIALLARTGLGLSLPATGGQALPLPNTLNDYQVAVNGVLAPLVYLDSIYVAFQVPSGTPTSGTANIVLQHASTGAIVGTVSAQMAQFNPGFFTSCGCPTSPGLAAANNNDGTNTINGPGNPIAANGQNSIVFYLTGGGPFPGVADGTIPSSPVSTTTQPVILSADGGFPNDQLPAKDIAYSGSSFYPGVWQINMIVDKAFPPGMHVITVTMNGTPSSIGVNGNPGTAVIYFYSK